MNNTKNPVAQKLMESFTQFHRLNWKQSPVKGLKSSEIMLLFCIKNTVPLESPGIKVSEISNLLKVAGPTVTQLISGLESKGLIERTMDKEDRRAVRVKMTEKGLRAVEQAAEAFFDSFNGLVDYLGEDKSIELTELLSKVFTYFSERRTEKFYD